MIKKKKQCTWSILFVIAIAVLSSCNKDEFGGNGATNTAFATIYTEKDHPSSFVKPYSLIPDGGIATFYITKSAVNKRELTNQRRVIATYTLLKNVTPQNLADHSLWNIRLDKIMDLTCKPPVLKSKTENPDQLGTGIVRINTIRFTGQYLNIEYEHACGSPDINLWFDDTNHPASKTWTVSLCINTPATSTEFKTKDYVSFDVLALLQETIEYFFSIKDDNCRPDKLILRYYESANVQKELRYTISYWEHGPYLSPESNQSFVSSR